MRVNKYRFVDAYEAGVREKIFWFQFGEKIAGYESDDVACLKK